MSEVWYELSNVEIGEWTFEEFTTLIGDWGHCFSHGVFDGAIRYANFDSSQLVVLDFDTTKNPFHPSQALERLQQFGLDCNVIYVTLSDSTDLAQSDEDLLKKVLRYRMIFILEKPIIRLYLLDYILKQLYFLFPEADNQCHAAQCWAGGKRVIYRNPDSRLLPLLVYNVCHTMETSHMTSKRRIGKMSDKIAALPNELVQLADPYNPHDVPNDPSGKEISLQVGKKGTSPIRNFNWGKARLECKLLDDFLGVSRKIEHKELYGLYLAMKRIEGGKKLWKTAVSQNPDISSEKLTTIAHWTDNFEKTHNIRWERPLKEYAPADDPSRSKYVRLTDIHFHNRSRVRKIHEFHHIPLSDAEAALKHKLNEVKGEPGKGIYIFKCATGLGKTREITSGKLDGYIISTPTHKLKEELSNRMKDAGIEHIVIPALPDNIPDVILKKYSALLAIGSFNHAAGYLRGLTTDQMICMGIPLQDANDLHLDLLRYFNKLDIAVKSSKPVLTTHKRILHTDFPNHSTIIFDEDLLDSIGEVKSVSLKDIRITLRHLDSNSLGGKFLSKIVEFSNTLESINRPFLHHQLIDNIVDFSLVDDKSIVEELLSASVRTEIMSILKAEILIIVPANHNDPEGEKIVHFIQRHHLPIDKKIIIMSATANEFIYSRLFPTMDFFDLSKVEMMGRGIQYNNRGFSRSTWGLQETQKILQKVSAHIGFKPTITYKSEKYQIIFRQPFMHFDNVDGTDELSGKDIAVVGTPNKPFFFYLLWAAYLGVTIDAKEAVLSKLPVEANGYEFEFMTFENLDLRKIQFHFIEEALVQAVGRARLIRTTANVEVFSNFPLVGFEQRNLKDLPGIVEEDISADEQDLGTD